MEVHAHSHTARKKWTHYLWEFLMLFLAVFCGFLAENQREHIVEHRREKHFGLQLLADMREDSALYSKFSKRVNGLLIKYKSFTTLMASKVPLSDTTVITSVMPLYWVYSVNATTTTYSQMKSSGSLRYIGNQTLIDDLQKYYEITLPRLLVNVNDHRNFFYKHIEPFFLNHFEMRDLDIWNDSLVNKKTVYINRTPESDFQLRNIMNSYQQDLDGIVKTFLQPNEDKAHELISLLKKEYHLK